MTTRQQTKNTQAKPNSKSLHPRNRHLQGYDFTDLMEIYPALTTYVKTNAYGNLAIEFADPLAVKALNAALLKRYYNIIAWDIPDGALCPPIPGRVDYIHYIADLLDLGEPPESLADTQSKITLLDIGTGASGIYPLLASQTYGWQCIASDINAQSLANVASIIADNPTLNGSITLRMQYDKNHIFEGVIQAGDYLDVSVCNPPFHASLEEALKGSQRKNNNLARNRGETSTPRLTTLNFGGLGAELWCKGGEQLFLKKMIKESKDFSMQCRWFTSLVSKSDNVKPAIKLIRKLGASDIREINMAQGNKITRILAWTFIPDEL